MHCMKEYFLPCILEVLLINLAECPAVPVLWEGKLNNDYEHLLPFPCATDYFLTLCHVLWIYLLSNNRV